MPSRSDRVFGQMQGLRCTALALALQFGCCLAHSSACANGHAEVCDDSAAGGAEDTSLIQLKRQIGGQAEEFPNLGKAWSEATDYVKDVVGKVASGTSQATTAVSEGVATALVAVGDNLNRTFALLATKMDALQTRVNNSKADITSGIVSAIALVKSLNVKAIRVPVNASYEDELNSTLEVTLAAWEIMDKSANAAVNALTNGLESAGLGDTARSFGSTMQTALDKADAFQDSLQQVSFSLWDSKVEARAEEILDKVNASLQVAADYVAAFPDDFLRSFTGLEQDVLNVTRGLLNTELLDKVSASFGGARAQATAAAEGLGNASMELIEALDMGLVATRMAVGSGALARHALGVPGLLLLSLLLSLSQATADA